MARFGDRIAYAVTLNEPDLPRLLTWVGLPRLRPRLERATLGGRERGRRGERYRLPATSCCPRTSTRMARRHDGRAPRGEGRDQGAPRRPAGGLSLAIIDDVVAGGDASVRDRKRAEVYDHWLRAGRATTTSSACRTTSAIVLRRRRARSPRARGRRRQRDGHGRRAALARRAPCGTPTRSAGVPVLVTEHGIGTADDALRAGFIEPSLAGLLDAIDDGVPVLGYCHWTLMDNFEWIFGYGNTSACTRSTGRRSSARRSPAPPPTPRSPARGASIPLPRGGSHPRISPMS